MARPPFDNAPREIVDLSSDSEDELPPRDGLEYFDARSQRQDIADAMARMDGLHEEVNAQYDPDNEAPDNIIDLTTIPDIDMPPSDRLSNEREAAEPGDFGGNTPIITEAECLQMILNVLPDIAVNHVLGLIREGTTDLARTAEQCEAIITQLLDGEAYPKEADVAKNHKRKREDDEVWKEYEKAERDPTVGSYESDAADLLKDEFPNVPVRHILTVLKEHKTLFKAYILLEEQVRHYDRITNNLFAKLGKPRASRATALKLIERGSQVPKELHAAKKKVEGEMHKRRKAEENEQAEQDNLKQAQKNNEMGECACCFNDVPLNRMISCNGDTTHFYCLECPKRQVETQMGQSNCRPGCFGVDDCDGTFTRAQLKQVLGDRTFERLEHMQQQDDLKAAGLDFLSECPFCDFKMECLPVEVDKEFRCQNAKCGKTSCRLCDKETHIPLTCKEADKDGQISLRHIVEEAMSAALIRQCNSCKHPFVKEYGCNKMTCSHCRNVQCYVCSKNVTNYEHFGEVARGRCPLHENVEDRHEQEVKKAADEAMAKVRAENPHLSDADLMVKVSDKVKQAEDVRRGQAQAQAQAFPYHMVNQQLQQRVPPPAMQLQQPPRRAGPAYPPAPQYVHQPHAFLPAPHIFHHHHMQPVPYQQNPPLPHPYVQFAPYPYNPYYYYYGPPNRHH